jgi:hypothetical protein
MSVTRMGINKGSDYTGMDGTSGVIMKGVVGSRVMATLHVPLRSVAISHNSDPLYQYHCSFINFRCH